MVEGARDGDVGFQPEEGEEEEEEDLGCVVVVEDVVFVLGIEGEEVGWCE